MSEDTGHQMSVSAVCTRMVPRPQVGFLFFGFIWGGLFHVTSISVFISSSFHSPVYHGKCTDSFVNNVGFAKKEKIKEPF